MDQPLPPSIGAAKLTLPIGGWLKSTRLGQSLSLRVVAERLKVSPQAVHQFEHSEAAGTISLRQLENVARAMDHRMVYALLPREPRRTKRTPVATMTAHSPTAGVTPVAPPVVEQSMLLENQAADRFD